VAWDATLAFGAARFCYHRDRVVFLPLGREDSILLGVSEFRAEDDCTPLAECRLHINILEMMAFYNVLLSFRPYLANSLVDCYIGNRSAMFNLFKGGGRSVEMTKVAKLIFHLQRAENFDIIVYHWIAC
jgi:hypothetical protein